MKYYLSVAVQITVSLTMLAACSISPETSRQSGAERQAESLVIPSQQSAIVQSGNGGPEVLSLQSIPVLEPGEGQVLIRIYAAAINPIDWRNRQGGGMAAGMAAGPVPGGEGMAAGPAQAGAAGGTPAQGAIAKSVPGLDFSGVVARVGAGVTSFKVGDAVFAKINSGQGGSLNGAYAQYAIAPVSRVAAKPTGLTYAEASGLGTVGITALRAVNQANVRAGQRVFIDGIAGGIGSSVAQIVKARGAYVLGTASSIHHDYLRSIGVDEPIDYKQVKFEEVVRQPVDVVIETVGVETATRALKIMKQGGVMTSVSGVPGAAACAAAGVTCIAISGASAASALTDAELLAEISNLAQAGKLKLHVDATYPLEQAAIAQDKNHEGSTEGKVVLLVDAARAKQK